MAQVTIRGGNVPTGRADYRFGMLLLPPATLFGSREAVHPDAIRGLHIASEDVVKRWAGTAGMSALRALALGPVGLFAGLLGGWDCEVTYVVQLRDGRDFLATSSGKTFDTLRARLR